MKCPVCRSRKLKVKDVRWFKFFGGVRKRKRSCHNCGYSDETDEKVSKIITTGRLQDDSVIALQPNRD